MGEREGETSVFFLCGLEKFLFLLLRDPDFKVF